MLSSTENRRIHFLRLLSDFPVLFKADLIFTFQESPLNSSTFQACANPVKHSIFKDTNLSLILFMSASDP